MVKCDRYIILTVLSDIFKGQHGNIGIGNVIPKQ